MARSGSLSKRAEWRKRLGRYRRSGLVVARFCRREGISTALFYSWRKRLDGAGTAGKSELARFQPVRLTGADAVMSVHLPGGVRVEAPVPEELKHCPEHSDPKSQRIHEVFTNAVAKGKRSVSGRMWAYRGMTVPLSVFDFTVSRHRDGPDLFLKDFRGKLMADCYSGYQGIALRSDGQIRRAACATHARRKVFDAREGYPLDWTTSSPGRICGRVMGRVGRHRNLFRGWRLRQGCPVRRSQPWRVPLRLQCGG